MSNEHIPVAAEAAAAVEKKEVKLGMVSYQIRNPDHYYGHLMRDFTSKHERVLKSSRKPNFIAIASGFVHDLSRPPLFSPFFPQLTFIRDKLARALEKATTPEEKSYINHIFWELLPPPKLKSRTTLLRRPSTLGPLTQSIMENHIVPLFRDLSYGEETPLHQAVANGDFALAATLAETFALHVNTEGLTPLHVLAYTDFKDFDATQQDSVRAFVASIILATFPRDPFSQKDGNDKTPTDFISWKSFGNSLSWTDIGRIEKNRATLLRIINEVRSCYPLSIRQLVEGEFPNQTVTIPLLCARLISHVDSLEDKAKKEFVSSRINAKNAYGQTPLDLIPIHYADPALREQLTQTLRTLGAVSGKDLAPPPRAQPSHAQPQQAQKKFIRVKRPISPDESLGSNPSPPPERPPHRPPPQPNKVQLQQRTHGFVPTYTLDKRPASTQAQRLNQHRAQPLAQRSDQGRSKR